METLLERFGIPQPKEFKEFNLIGIDFGDGEISASVASWNGMNHKMSVLTIWLDMSHNHDKYSNAFYISEKESAIVSGVNDIRFSGKDGGTIYYNFKVCPGDQEINAKYRRDSGEKGNTLTYGQIMAKSFSCLVNRLFDCNETIDRGKPTIILVGRPSSTGWKASERAYAKLLQEGLQLPKGQKPVYVAIQAESTAAMASEIDPQWDERRIRRGEVVVVLDSGSSTFDITVISPDGGVVGEDSFQFGGNQLDENLLKLFQQSIQENHPGKELETRHGHKLNLRIKKEQYYGDSGTCTDPQMYGYSLQDGTGDYFIVDSRTMKEALNQVPVKVFKQVMQVNGRCQRQPYGNGTYNSWLEACRAIYTGFYNQMQRHFKTAGDSRHPLVPDRIILSGGVSVMPEVQAMIEEVFGVRPTLTTRPNYSVSTGLGYVLGTEVRKKELLDELVGSLDAKLPDANTLLESTGDAGEDEEWDNFIRAMEDWAASPENRSLKDLHTLWSKKFFNESLSASLQRGAARWYQDRKVKDVLTGILKEKFLQLFPDYAAQFRENLPSIRFDNLGSVNVTIKSPIPLLEQGETFTDQQAYESFLTQARDRAWRNTALNRMKGLERSAKKGCDYFYYSPHPVERGVFIFRRTEVEIGQTKDSYQGFRKMYLNENAVTLEVAQKTRKKIIDQLQDPLKDYVESITPYFNMTARQVSQTDTPVRV